MIPDSSRLGGFLAASIVLLVIPGPAVLYIVARGVDQGRRAGLVSVLGVGLGNLVQAVAAALGLSALLATSATAFTVVKLLGAAYLIVLGLQRLFGRGDEGDARRPRPRAMKRLFGEGFVVAVLNPKTALFFLAFIPQFLDAHGDATGQVLFLGVLFVLLGLCTDACYAIAAGTVSRTLRQHRSFSTISRYVTGTVYVGLGVAAAFAGRARD